MRRPVIDVDELPHNADWTKKTLDFFLPDGQRPVENLDDLRAYLRLHRISVEDFKQMPAYTNALRKQPWFERFPARRSYSPA